MKTYVSHKGKRISIDVLKTGFIRKGLGLTFRTKNTKNLLFDFNRPVTWQGNLTSFFVFFPFLTLWLDNKNKVLDFKVVRPFVFSINQKKKFYKIIEVPLNRANFTLVKKFFSPKDLKRYYRR